MLSRASLSLLCACVCIAADASAQEGQGGPPRARKIDEFGRLRGCDSGARADNFAIELQNEPGARGYIVARDSRERLMGAAHAWGRHLIRYLVELRGMDESRFVLLDGARVAGEEFSMELWLVPEGAEPPRVKPPAEDAPAFSGKYTEHDIYDDQTFYDVDGGVDASAFNIGHVYRAYAWLLNKQPDSRGYLVVYSPPGASPGYWRRVGTREQQKLASEVLPADRMTVINGGALPAKEKAADDEGDGEETHGRLELWVGAKDGPPPVRHVEEETRLTEALMVGANSFYYEEEEKKPAAWMLSNLVEMLRANEGSIACFVVYPGDGTGMPTGEEGVEVPAPNVFKMAERWKAELLKKHGLAAHRVVLLSGPEEGSAAGRIEAWAVPHGAALPDPFARAEEEAGEEESEEGEEGEEGGEQQPPPPPGR